MEKSSQIIKAKALRKKGTADIWYRYIPNHDDPFDEMPLPDPWENDLDIEDYVDDIYTTIDPACPMPDAEEGGAS